MAEAQAHRLHRDAAGGTGEALLPRQARPCLQGLDLQAGYLQRSRRRRRRSLSRAPMSQSPNRNGYALVTGGGTRLGATLVRRLAADGWAVAIHYNQHATEADALAEEIKSAGGRAVTVAGDLGRIE